MPSDQLIAEIPELDKEIYQVKSGVFVSQSRAKSGEIIYLKMELITEENKPYIDQYIKQVLIVGGDNRCGLLSFMTQYIEPTESKSYRFTAEAFSGSKWDRKFIPYEHIKSETGFSDEELIQYINIMGKNGFHSKNPNRADLHDTVSGSAFIRGYINTGSYFVYACKDPYFTIQKTFLTDKFSLKEFISQYNNLLICVGSEYSEKFSGSRGIFRNPITTIENTHKGLAATLIGFSGAVAYRFLNKNEIRIGPVGRMPGILCAVLKKNEFSVEGMSDAEVRRQAAEKFSFFDYSRSFNIQLSALNRVFIESQCLDQEKNNHAELVKPVMIEFKTASFLARLFTPKNTVHGVTTAIIEFDFAPTPFAQ